ncbi:MAG: class I SAM-dependent methyltransferase [Gaiellaceae bacterium]
MDELVLQRLVLPGGELRLLQPKDGADIPDDGPIEWAPIAPYWSVLWRSGQALAGELPADLTGKCVIELGCGLGLPSMVAARGGAEVLATDQHEEALELLERNARENGVRVERVRVDWSDPGELVERGPFDLVLAADVLYERASVALLLDLLPRLGGEVWLADPGRPGGRPFLEQVRARWGVTSTVRGVVEIHRFEPGA